MGATSSGGGGSQQGATAALAMEGVRLYVHPGAALSGNTRGPLGVIDAEYVELEGDQVGNTCCGAWAVGLFSCSCMLQLGGHAIR